MEEELDSDLEQETEHSETERTIDEYFNELIGMDLDKLTPDMLQEYKSKLEMLEKEELTPEQEELRTKKFGELYRKTESAKSYLGPFFDGMLEGITTPPVPTGFERLDNILDGGLFEGLYIIGAISSLGKTTFAMQIADQVASSGKDVLIFSLEMSRYELMAKSISRNSYSIPRKTKGNAGLAKTARDLLRATWDRFSELEQEHIQESIIKYNEGAEHIYIVEGEGELGVNQVVEAVEKHIKLTGNTPLVVIDYLQILAPWDPRATDKQNIDKAILELKRLTRKYKLPLIGISSVNRMSYNEKVSMEMLKESGSLEYSSDVIFGLQLHGAGTFRKEGNTKIAFDVNEAKSRDPRQVELIILKNRNGRTGDILSYKFTPRFNYFEECDPFQDDI